MKRRSWDSKTKTKIVLEGLSGRPLSEISNEYGIHQNQYYTWRDKFLSEAHRAFESERSGGEVNRLRKKNQEEQQLVAIASNLAVTYKTLNVTRKSMFIA